RASGSLRRETVRKSSGRVSCIPCPRAGRPSSALRAPSPRRAEGDGGGLRPAAMLRRGSQAVALAPRSGGRGGGRGLRWPRPPPHPPFGHLLPGGEKGGPLLCRAGQSARRRHAVALAPPGRGMGRGGRAVRFARSHLFSCHGTPPAFRDSVFGAPFDF